MPVQEEKLAPDAHGRLPRVLNSVEEVMARLAEENMR